MTTQLGQLSDLNDVEHLLHALGPVQLLEREHLCIQDLPQGGELPVVLTAQLSHRLARGVHPQDHGHEPLEELAVDSEELVLVLVQDVVQQVLLLYDFLL